MRSKSASVAISWSAECFLSAEDLCDLCESTPPKAVLEFEIEVEDEVRQEFAEAGLDPGVAVAAAAGDASEKRGG